MKAVIFNSGIGKRMGEFTENNHKSMAELYNGETIFERQIRLLMEAGINEIVVTVGPFSEQLKAVAAKDEYKDLKFVFVDNPIYKETNYIYSMHLAREHLDDDVLMLHGDLVFDSDLVGEVLNHPASSLCLYNDNLEQPAKDFKGRIENNRLKEVSTEIFDSNCYAFQPFYKLSREDLRSWLSMVAKFVEEGNVGVYAEDALNVILEGLMVVAMNYSSHYVNEVDTLEDLKQVSKDIRRVDSTPGAIFKKNVR